MGGLSEDVPPETVSSGLGRRVRTIRALLTKTYPYRDTYPFNKAVYEEFGGKQLVWGTGYPKPRWELSMDKELAFVQEELDFYTPRDRELILGNNALGIWKFPKG